MSSVKFPPGEMRQRVAELRAQGMSQRQMSRALGISTGTISTHVLNIRADEARKAQTALRDGAVPIKPVVTPDGFEVSRIATQVGGDGSIDKQWVQSRLAGELGADLVPDGHVVKGLSTLVDESGAVRAQWVKTKLDEDLFMAAQEAAFRVMAEKLEPLPPIPWSAPNYGQCEENLCTQYTITDEHVGMLAWGRETGEPWDLRIAEEVLTRTFDRMISSAPPSRLGIVNQLGDFLHFDSLRPVTFESGHILDADSRYQKVVEVAVRVLRRIVEMALDKHREVRVYMHEGNHDPAGSVWLRVMFAALYADNPRVYVETSPLPYVAFGWGKTFLGYHHGHLAKAESLPLLFAARFPELWGSTVHRYIHKGHEHHVHEKEHPGVIVIQHSTLAAADAYAARGGWFSKRQATAITYDTEYGEVARQQFLPVGVQSD